VAILFAREGSDVSIAYLPEEQVDAEETKRRVEKEGRECLLIPGDLMDNKACKKAVDEHIKKFGKLDVLVNNASKQVMNSDFANIDLDVVESTFRSNILQMFAVTKYALQHMEKGSS
jgi:NAD(P)-dependent dehydrogenase (short-subunit alcohol dehydrogenase family)